MADSFLVSAKRARASILTIARDAAWVPNGIQSLFFCQVRSFTGNLISTSCFSKGTEETAFGGRAAPLPLIDGDKRIDLLIEHGIDVRKRTLEVLPADSDAFADLEGDA